MRILPFFYISLCQASPEKVTSKIELTPQEQVWLKEHPQILVGGSPDWTPFNFVDANGQYSGIANDYLNLIAQKTGFEFTVSIAPWSKNLQKIRDKKIDLLGAVYYTDERSEYLTYSSPYFEVLDYFFIRDDLKVKTFKDLNDKRVAIPKQYAHIELINKHFPKIQIVPVDTFGQAIDAVLENRADMLYDTYGALTYTLGQEGINTIIPFKSTRHIGKNPIHIVTRKDNPELAGIIQKGLNAITLEEKRNIYNKWLGSIKSAGKPALQLTEREQDWINKHPVIHYGAEKDWPPYDFVNELGIHTGLANDYLKLISQSSGLKFAPVIDDWDKLLVQTRQQKIDLLPAIYFSATRNKYLHFTQPYLSVLDYFFIREDIKAETIDELNGKIVAIPKGYLRIDTVRQLFPHLKLLQTDSLLTAIQSVIEKKADILLDSYAVINHLLNKHGIKSIRPFKALANNTDNQLYMAVRHDQEVLANILNKVLASLPETDKKQIHDRWLGYQTESLPDAIKLSKSEQKWLASHPDIRFTGDPHWLPYEAFNKQGEYIGIVAEHLKLIEQKLGIKLNIAPSSSWLDAIDKVKQGEIDVISETNDSELKSHLLFTQSYISSPVIIVMKNDEYYVDNIEQIKQRKIALIKEYGYTAKIINKYPDLDFVTVNTIQDGLTAVSTGKIDALIATLAQASYHISELGYNNVRIVGKTEFSTQLAFGIRKELEPLIPLFNRALNAISQREKQRILTNWGKPKYAPKFDYLLLSKIAGITFLIFIWIIYWNRKLANEVAHRKEIEAQTQTLIDNIPLVIIVTSHDGHILTANPKAIHEYGVNLDKLELYNIVDFYHDSSERELMLKELREKGKIEQKIIKFKRPDDSLRSLMLSIMPINYNKQSALLTITLDMTERLEMEAAIKTAKESAESANRAKSEFLANMSHEIRTPMNAIIGFTELLNEQVQDPKHKSFIKTIQSAGTNLLVLINDILDLSKIEAGKLQIKKTPCNPNDLFSELREVFTIKMQEKNIDFIFDIAPVIPQSLQLDATRLRQVLFNLVGNAVKFTEKGHIQLKVRTLNENDIHSKLDLLIEVEDTGIGIPEDQQQLIFQNFEQSSGQNTKKYGGTGLGLSITKRLVEMMGGEISLSSQPGHGSKFTILLLNVDIASLAPEGELYNPKPSTAIRFLPGNILVVDDVKDNRDLLLAIFTDTKLHVSAAKNGLEAVELCKQQSYDLVLMDIHMPVMDGYEASAEIKSFSNVPIIALTASVMKNEFDRIKSEDFAGYLRKPVLKADLVHELCRFLPFEKEIAEPENNSKRDYLTTTAREQLPNALDKLEKLGEQYKTIDKKNNISEIRNFTDSLLKISKEFPITPIQDYAERLKSATDSFDIATIKLSLNNYPQLIHQLKQLTSEDKKV